MDLVDLGGFPGLGRYWFWSREYGALIDVVEQDPRFYVRCVKGFRLIRQGEEGRELWTRSLSKMTRYLQDGFEQFRLSVDFCGSIDSQVIGVDQEVEELGQRSAQLLSRREELEGRIESLRRSMQLEGSAFSDEAIENRFDRARQELEETDAELDRVLERLEFLDSLVSEWQDTGYCLGVCFSVSTGFEPVNNTSFQSVVADQLKSLKSRCDRSIKQRLQGENFKLLIQELDTPLQLTQHLYTPLVHVDDEDAPKDLMEDALAKYMAYSAEDVEVDGAVREESNAAAARSVNAVLQLLKSTGSADVSSVELSGPLVGHVRDTQMAFGFDPAEQPHYYIVGATGSGKTYTKRVLLENCLALGYNVVSITPRDLQALAGFEPFDGDGTGLKGDYYWIGDDLLLDEPDDYSEFFDGASFVSLQGRGQGDREEFVRRLFSEAARLGQVDVPLFIFLDEAHLFASGEAAEAIQSAIREVRKFGVHVVLATQSPMDFNRNYKHIRQNTVANFFLQGEYWNYADSYLSSKTDITALPQGVAWFTGRGFEPVELDIRKPLSRVDGVSRSDLQELDTLYSDRAVDLEGRTSSSSGSRESLELADEQAKVVEAIRDYVAENDEAPSKNKVIEYSPFGTTRTSRILDELKDTGAVISEKEERYGNTATVFTVTQIDYD